MTYHNSAVYDVVELVQVMIDAFWQKYGHPYTHFSESNSGLKALDLAKVMIISVIMLLLGFHCLSLQGKKHPGSIAPVLQSGKLESSWYGLNQHFLKLPWSDFSVFSLFFFVF